MNWNPILRCVRHVRPGLAVSPFVVLIFCLAPAEAQSVACPGQSLNDALTHLDKSAGLTVVVTGTCNESVVVEGFKHLTLQGTAAVLQRPAGWTSALRINASDLVELSGFTIQGAGPESGPPLVAISSSNVTVQNTIIQGSNSNGLQASDFSTVNIGGSRIQDNKGAGVAVDTHANVQISAHGPGPSVIQRNGTGLAVSSGGSATVGKVQILNNTGAGVSVSTSETVALGTWGGPDAPTISGNGTSATGSAVSVDKGGILWMTPGTAVVDNPGHGVSVFYDGWAAVCCGSDPVTTISRNGGIGFNAWMGGQIFFWGNAVVEQNREGGLALHSNSRAHIGSRVAIRRNGDQADPDSYGGIRAELNSVLYGTSDFTVSDNYGPGVFVRGGSTITLSQNVAITGNKGYGVQLEMNSSAEFGDDNNITGNKRLDLLCTAGSVAGAVKGAHPTIGRMDCLTWTRLTSRPAWELSQ